MFSNPPILSDFVYPIPYCHWEIDLNSILKIFQRWNCQQIAIFQQNGKWGLIDSVDLLSLITEVSMNQKLVASGGFKGSMPQQTFGLNSHASSIVKPAVVYQSGMRLDEFLNGLPKGALGCDRQKYLLVDRLGELQGKLDKNKILEYLASEYKPNLVNHSQPLAPSNYFELLDFIALPLKIETTSGEELYFNTCWEEIIIGDRPTQHQLQPDRAIASWWIEQQAKTHRDNPKKAQSKKLEDRLNGDRSVLSSSLSSSKLDLKVNVNSINENQQSSSDRSKLDIEQSKNWNYVTIPLTDSNKEYQLILATEAVYLPSLPNIANKLLAIVSHELKSPLTGIVGLSNLLEAEKLGQLNQRQTRYVELIHSSGQKMMGIVNDLVKLTTLTQESYKIESESIDLELLCRQVYQQLYDQLQSLTRDTDYKTGQLELDLESNTRAIASKSHLSCILFYLMMEAIEFAKSPERLKIKISSLSGSIAITISSILTTISSEPNYKIDSSLRLAIVEYLTEFIQGNLKSDRSVNRCQFTLLLPTIQSGQISQSATAGTTDETAKRNLTILCLYPEAEAISDRADNHNSLNFDLKSFPDGSKHSSNYRHRIIEANGLEQAHTLARIWQLDVIVLEGDRLTNPLEYLQLLQTSEYLSALPLITLDSKTTQAANQIKGLNVYPCLLPAKHRRIEDLMQVIQIAVG